MDGGPSGTGGACLFLSPVGFASAGNIDSTVVVPIEPVSSAAAVKMLANGFGEEGLLGGEWMVSDGTAER
jgi:hypothetical protein